MADLSTMSTEELLKLKQSRKPSLSDMGTEDLIRIKEQRGKSQPGFLEDLGRGGAAGLFQGGIDLLGSIVNPAASPFLDTTTGVRNTLDQMTGRESYDAQGKLAKVVQAGARGLVGGAAGGGAGGVAKLGLNALRYGALPMVASEVAGQATEGSKWETAARIAAGLATGGAAAGFSRAAGGGRVPTAKPPTGETLLKVADKEYDVLRQLDVRYQPDAVISVAERAQQALLRKFNPSQIPEVWDVVSGLTKKPAAKPGETSFVSYNDLDAAYQHLRAASRNKQNLREGNAAQIVRDALDGFVGQPDPAAVISGPADLAAQIHSNARGNYAAGKQSQRLTNYEESAELRSNLGLTGSTLENRIRARATDIVDPLKPDLAKGLRPGEIEQLRGVSQSTKPRNILREAGNYAGGKGWLRGLMPTIVGGAAWSAGGPMLGIPAAVATGLTSTGLKQAATGLTQGAFRRVDEAVRSRAPYSQHLQSQALPAQTLSPEGRAALGQGAVVNALSDDTQYHPGPGSPDVNPRIEEIIRALIPQ